METPQIFSFEDNQVRTILVNDEPYFVGKDVAEILGYKNTSKALKDHVDNEDKRGERIVTPSGEQVATIINESGLYSLILKSKLLNARKFKRWVTSEVLPQIRKYGMYAKDEILENPDLLIEVATKLKEERTKRLIAEQKVAEYEPKITYLDTILASKDAVTTSQIAADYGMSAVKLNKLLHQLGIQRKVGGQWLLYKKHMNCGYTKSHTGEILQTDGTKKIVMSTKWTQKGRLFIYDLLKEEGYYPQMDLWETA